MLDTMTVRPENMYRAATGGFINATDCADYLAKTGMPFRDAYTIVGRLVNHCIATGQTLESLSLEDYRKMSEVFDRDVYQAIDLKTCVETRLVEGGPSEKSVKAQLESVAAFLKERGYHEA